MTDRPQTAREVYRAYLRGEITPEQIDQRAREWNEAHRTETPRSDPRGEGD